MKLLIKILLFGGFALFVFDPFHQVLAQQKVVELEDRVNALENYIERLAPSLNDFAEGFSGKINYQIQISLGKVVVLDIVNKEVSKVTTNTGVLLVFVEKREKIENGYRLYLSVGNPALATYGGLKMKFRWGRSWDPTFAKLTYEEWRESMQEAEYEYAGNFKPGTWTSIAVDISPVDKSKFEHIECEMLVTSVELLNPIEE